MNKVSLNVFIIPPQQKGGMPSVDIPPDAAEILLQGKTKERILIEFDNGKIFHRALRKSKNGNCSIVLGKTTLKEAGKTEGFMESITLRLDNSEFGMPMPEELQEILNQDEEALKHFMDLKPGIRRSFLYYINGAKTIDTRLKRSFKLVENLKQGIISAGNYTGPERG